MTQLREAYFRQMKLTAVLHQLKKIIILTTT